MEGVEADVDMIDGSFDISIRNVKMYDSTLIARKLVKDNLIICAALDYLEKYGIPQTLNDLTKHRIIKLTVRHRQRATTHQIAKHPANIDNGESVGRLYGRYRHCYQCALDCLSPVATGNAGTNLRRTSISFRSGYLGGVL